MTKKPYLFLVHSFPTNSILLSGLKDFLSDFFTVHFVDLPGFHSGVPPLKGLITVKKFSNYLDRVIAESNVGQYLVGGVSFGFLVVNNAKLDKRCKAIIAMEPYINTACLNVPFFTQKKLLLLSWLLNLVVLLKLESFVWNKAWFKKFLQKEMDYPMDRVETILSHFDPRTFLTVTSSLLTYNKIPRFHKLPYFLIGNFADKTINFDKAVELFTRNLYELHIASEPIDHYPKELTKRYFSTRIPQEHIQRMLACIEGEVLVHK